MIRRLIQRCIAQGVEMGRPSEILVEVARKDPELWDLLERKRRAGEDFVPPVEASAGMDEGRGVGESGLAVYLDFTDAVKRLVIV